MKSVWTFTVEGERHVVELNLGLFFGGRKVYVDGELAIKERNFLTVNEEYRFNVGDKPALLEIGGS